MEEDHLARINLYRHSLEATRYAGRISAQVRLLVIRSASQAHQGELAMVETSPRYSGNSLLALDSVLSHWLGDPGQQQL